MYQALYRKYRPQTFDDVVGQRSITETLKAQVTAGKLSHAYLFTGTRGTGKTSCAKILAKAVNCLDPQNGNPCNQCSACRAIDNGSCMDVMEIDAASNNGVDHVRTLRDEAVYTPSEVKKRVYIVDEVHMLSISAFNALLKIIEEPPEHLLFILATTELHKVPATILSRCQRFSFGRLRMEDISARLNFVAYEEGIDLAPEAADLLARLADGALRDGLSLLDQCASAVTDGVTVQSVCDALGLAGERKTAELLSAVADRDANRALSIFSDLFARGKDLSALLDELSSLARDLLVLSVAPKSGMGMLTGVATAAEMKPIAEKLSPAELLRIVTTVQKTTAGFAMSADRRMDTELCLMELCNPSLAMDAAALSARLGHLEEQLASGNFVSRVQTTQAEAPAESAAEVPAAQAERPPEPKKEKSAPAVPPDFWPELLAKLKPALPVQIGSFFAQAGALKPELAGDLLRLTADSEFVLNIVNTAETQKTVADKASAFLGRPVSVKFQLRGAGEAAEGDPMADLLSFGGAHSDIVTIKE